MFAIVDCNNFYASCERVFNPKLIGKPIIVLSSNDGCVIARSNEAKALGIKMCAPFFEIERLCKKNGVITFSSNFTLYGDMSNRVMTVIEESWPEVEIYSVDEAFLDLRCLPPQKFSEFFLALHQKILRYTGIPVSIGIGPTKTLAKLANYVAKRKLMQPVCQITPDSFWFNSIPVGEIWGIGRKLSDKLNNIGVMTARDLASANPDMIRKKFNVLVMQTVMELQGHSCLALSDPEPKKSITSSRSFGEMQTDFDSIANALASHCATASEKLREQNSVAGLISVFIRTNPFRKDLPYYSNSAEAKLIHPTSDVRAITTYAKECLQKIYKKGYYYKKVGILLNDIAPLDTFQNDLFDDGAEFRENSQQLMATLDAINMKYGSGTLRTACEGYNRGWASKQTGRSPCYTTRWDDLPVVII